MVELDHGLDQRQVQLVNHLFQCLKNIQVFHSTFIANALGFDLLYNLTDYYFYLQEKCVKNIMMMMMTNDVMINDDDDNNYKNNNNINNNNNNNIYGNWPVDCWPARS